MRISTAQYYEASAANYQRNYANVIKSGDEVSSQVKLNTAGDDPVGAARVLQLQQMNAMLTQYQTNASAVNTKGTHAESVLSSINTAIQRAQDLVIGAGSAAFSDKDRLANAAELKELQSQILGLMNSQDADGSYLFAGSKSTTVPYAINPDGTYSYQGDQSKNNVDIGNGISTATNTTGWEAFEQAVNTTRTSATLTSPATNDGLVSMSGGVVTSSADYNAKFVGGQPYSITFTSSTEFVIRDKDLNDVTAEASGKGSISSDSAASQNVTFRGLQFSLNVNLTDAQKADKGLADAAMKTHSFDLAISPSSISTARMPGNASSSVITGSSVTDPVAFNESFPQGGAILKFTTADDFEVYASPYDAATSKPITTGTVVGNTATVAGVTFNFSGPRIAGDQFTAQGSTQQNQNILNTLSSVINALTTPVDGDVLGQQRLQASLSSAIGNLQSASEQIGTALGDIGARTDAATKQQVTNQTLLDNGKLESSSITASDPAEAITRLTLEQSMLQASQLVFTKISTLNLFSQL
ncbi:flagellar hook-associated protein 3 [Pseudomonas abietaniphila]|uniref:Flagellar hook-associated protein 3 FlgL n=1 Tax=Pseudomonas abietaniphila TaxID=89065 RepID=A0A1G8S5M8_9PSED|nr:flagellar hook-associated protein 3 [Pseudomonas abietaniphila]SDJ24558.1 flagellar hook-associated protein 3 FlgL [Pseudomonas abietaniphila]